MIHEDTCRRVLITMHHESTYYSSGGTGPLANFKRGEIFGFASDEEGLMLRVIDNVLRISTFLKQYAVQSR